MKPSGITIIGVPMDLGAGRRGVDMGPSALRIANLKARLTALGYEVTDRGNIEVDQPESSPEGDTKTRYLPQIAHTCARLADVVEQAATNDGRPLVLGGDHSIAVGTVAGMARNAFKNNRKLGLIWIDAHADMNTPDSSPSGNVHGMPLASIVGLGPRALTELAGPVPMVDPSNIAIVGLRSVDELERLNVRSTGIHAFTMRDIDEQGIATIMQRAIHAATSGTSGFHLSFDIDSVDPDEAPGVGTPVPGGLTYREAHLAMELVGDSDSMMSMEMVEVNPVMDVSNRTARLAVDLILSALGKRIL